MGGKPVLAALVVALVYGVAAWSLTRGATGSPAFDVVGAVVLWAVLIVATAALGVGLVRIGRSKRGGR